MFSTRSFAAYLVTITLQASLAVSQVALNSCNGKCTVMATGGYRADWYPLHFNTTITAATVVQVVNTDLHTTRLSTIFNDLPAGYALPTNTNAQGTQTTQVTYVKNGQRLTTELAFPTAFNVWPQSYVWRGVLATTDKNGRDVCATTSTATVSVDYYSQPATITMPTHSMGPDPNGLFFKPTEVDLTSVIQRYKTAFPSEAALQSCESVSVFPFVADFTARFVTDTSTSFEGGTSTRAPKTSSSKASTPHSNVEVKTTQTVRTVVSEGASGPTTVVETVQVTYAESVPSATANVGSSTTIHGVLSVIWLGMMLAL